MSRKNIEIIKRDYIKDINQITVVPGKPGEDNHLDLLLNHSNLDKYRSNIDTKLLYTMTNYKKQKEAGSFLDRANNVLGVFNVRRNVRGHVLLIDDILTSGSTTMECAKMLYSQGAEKVTVLPLAIMQSESNAQFSERIKDLEGNEFSLNFKKIDSTPFWASKKKYLGYNEGKEKYLSQNFI
ncbi:hypothetical protein C2I05_02785 [Bacillus subtilis]|uniref:ComF family protein n=1 Tax=Bacillus subtilis TaxID=1423 RepID=UPI00201D6A15|nr:hypothetical protein [Bacillus subtilis]UQZ69533.1 hypothetical protein C2I05_02785 [Bacillus subtilis]